MLSLRAVEPADEPFLVAVYSSTRAHELALVNWDEATKIAFVQMQYTAQQTHYRTYYPDADFQVILLDDRPIGRLYVYRGQTEIRVMDIALLPAYRHAGIGTALMTELLAEAAVAGKPVTLHVEPFNPARRLYERLGFRPVADEGIYWRMAWSVARPEPSAGATRPYPHAVT